MKELIGKTIIALFVQNDDSRLVFRTDSGWMVYDVDGECGSQTWFSDILGVDALIGGAVVAVDDLELGDYDVNNGRCRENFDEVYVYKVTTDRGYADIVFRNSSNGAYGGTCKLSATYDIFDPKDLQEIDVDWQA